MSRSGTTSEALAIREPPPHLGRYPTFAELRSSDVPTYSTLAAGRLIWSLSGSLKTAMSVMRSPYNLDVLVPYFQRTAGEESPWYIISKSPLTHPPVSAITVKVDTLETWESNWMEVHRDHYVPDTPGPDPKDGDCSHILACCGSDRPRHKSGGVLVTASPSGSGFVTIHDYVASIHPWLMRSRDDILEGMDCFGDLPDPEDMDLVVDLITPECLSIIERSDFIADLGIRHQNSWRLQDLETSATYRTC